MISREIFKNSIKIQKDIDELINTLYNMGIDIIDNKAVSNLISDHSKLLSLLVGDDIDDIGYFMYELEFGKTYEDGMITDKDGSIIDFSNEDKLYDYFLNKNNTNENTIKNMSTDKLAEYINSVFRAGEMFGKGMLTMRDFENYKEWLSKEPEKE